MPVLTLEQRKEWTAAYVNSLPDSAFAYIEEGGTKDDTGRTTPRSLRHYPHHDKGGKVDLPHLRNALARAEQNPSTGKKALPHLEKHAKAEGVGDRDMSDVDERARKAKKPPDDEDEDDQAMGEGDEQDEQDEDDKKKAKKEKRSMPEPSDTNSSGQTQPLTASDGERALAGLRSALVSAGLAPEGFAGDLAMRFGELGREISDLRMWADIGRQARDQLVEDCKKAGVRAFGKTWSEAAYGATLTRGSFSELQALYTHWSELGGVRFPAGRATQDGTDTQPVQPEPLRVPARAFRA